MSIYIIKISIPGSPTETRAATNYQDAISFIRSRLKSVINSRQVSLLIKGLEDRRKIESWINNYDILVISLDKIPLVEIESEQPISPSNSPDLSNLEISQILYCEICKHLDIADIMALARTCKYYHDLFSQPESWKHLLKIHYNLHMPKEYSKQIYLIIYDYVYPVDYTGYTLKLTKFVDNLRDVCIFLIDTGHQIDFGSCWNMAISYKISRFTLLIDIQEGKRMLHINHPRIYSQARFPLPDSWRDLLGYANSEISKLVKEKDLTFKQ